MRIKLFTDDKTEVRVEVYIPAKSPAEIFTYWTETNHLEKWWVQKVTQIDARLGGAYQFDWIVNDSTLRGEFVEFVTAKKLSFTWKWDHLPELPQRTVTLLLEADNAQGTYLKIWHRSYGDTEGDVTERQNHIDGWQYFMEMLLKYCQAEAD